MYTYLSIIFLIAAFMAKGDFRFIGLLVVSGIYAIAGVLYGVGNDDNE